MSAAERDLVVRLTPDPSALLEFLDTAAGALITAADTLRAAYPATEDVHDHTPGAACMACGEASPAMTFEEMPEWERELLAGQPVDRTGLCDHCDKPQTGGAAGGGLSPEHWCDDHRPEDFTIIDDDPDGPAPDDDSPLPDDDDAPEPWAPKVGDRVQSQAPARLAGTGTVAKVDDFGPYPVWVRLDSRGEEVALAADEVRPLADTQPATVGPERLFDSVRGVGCICGECRQQREMAVAHVQERFAQYPVDTPAAQVYADWFGGAQ